MELFTITRYSESGEIQKEPLPEQEDKLLKKLLKKAKKRKLEEYEVENTTKEITDKTYQEQSEEQIVSVTDENQSNTNKEDTQTEQTNDKIKFQVLGDDVFQQKKKVQMVLPSWLAYPTIISANICDNNEIESIDDLSYLSPQIIENLKKMKVSKLFPVQKAVIPSILSAHSKPFPFKPRDICVSAPTGSGKTFAFGIPLIQLLMNRVECKIRALIVLPVNELAVQVYKVLKQLANGTLLSICLLSKTFPFAKEQERLIASYKGEYFSKVDIIVTTPGRLVEHLHSTKGFCLKNLKFLIIDEADRIMEQIHFNWLYHLDEHVRKTSDEIFSGSVPPLCLHELMGSLANQPHKMLFSATLSHDPEKLMSLKLFQPKLFTTVIESIEELAKKLRENTNENDITSSRKEMRGEFIGKYTTPAELTEKYCLTELRIKPLTLFALIKENKWNKFLCFTNSVDSAFRLTHVLRYLFYNQILMEVNYLSATLTAKARAELLDKFTKETKGGLVCSDALARGIDIPDVDVVISYDVPRHIKTYIHRIGRTARAGRHGTAIILLPSVELTHFKKLLNNAGKTIGEEITVNSDIEADHANIYQRALTSLKIALETDQKMEKIKRKMIYSKNKPISSKDSQLSVIEKLQKEINTNFESNYQHGDEENVPRKFRKNKQIKMKIGKTKFKDSYQANIDL